ncbi:MAG: phytanoyl-CoA dioxygenase family protein [Alphaproteobacteria bacterium]|nr:phytanoyl-CoA dioxygenase family protein [Alphaproteobacteria bacterium]
MLLRGALDAGAAAAARAEVLDRLAAVGEIAAPAEAAIATGKSNRAALHPDLGAFWRSVCEGTALRHLTHGPAMRAVAQAMIGEDAVPFDFLWLRAMLPGRASPLHFDHVYMNRGSARIVTFWVPLGDVPIAAGPIVVVEGSHRFADLAEAYRGHDVDRDPSRPGSLAVDALSLAAQRGCRLLSADFRAGDVLAFGMFTLHGSLDNAMSGDRIRLSADIRWQPAGDARDGRWFGAPPPGHGGKSYGGLNGALPLGAPGIAR